jgi:hypothetical protein
MGMRTYVDPQLIGVASKSWVLPAPHAQEINLPLNFNTVGGLRSGFLMAN